jgi:hypothetical protein
MVNYFNCLASYLTGHCIIMEDGLVIRYDPVLPDSLTCFTVENRKV